MAFLPLFQFRVKPHADDLLDAYRIPAVILATPKWVRLMPFADRQYVVVEPDRPALSAYLKQHFIPVGGVWLNPARIDWVRSTDSACLQIGHGYTEERYGPVSVDDCKRLIAMAGLTPISKDTCVNLTRVYTYDTAQRYLDLSRIHLPFSDTAGARLSDHARRAGWVRYDNGWLNPEEARVLYLGRFLFSPDTSVPIDAMTTEGVDRVMAADWMEVGPNRQVNLKNVSALLSAPDKGGGIIHLGADMTVLCDYAMLPAITLRMQARDYDLPRGGG